MGKTKSYAVIGDPVDHSLSPQIHQIFAEQLGIEDLEYTKIASNEDKFAVDTRDFAANGGLGVNVTLPLKGQALELAKERSEVAELAQAANVLSTLEDGGWRADNTDGSGLVADLKRLGWLGEGGKVLLIGAGGSAAGIIPALLLSAPPMLLVIANRTLAKAQTLAERYGHLLPDSIIATSRPYLASRDYDLCIDATSVATLAGEGEALPDILTQGITLSERFYSLAYGDVLGVTVARRMGRAAEDGLGMLVQQAADSFYIWHGVRPDTEPVRRAVQERIKASEENEKS